MHIPEQLANSEAHIKERATNLIHSTDTWRQSYYDLKAEGSQMITTQALSKLDISKIMTMIS